MAPSAAAASPPGADRRGSTIRRRIASCPTGRLPRAGSLAARRTDMDGSDDRPEAGAAAWNPAEVARLIEGGRLDEARERIAATQESAPGHLPASLAAAR